LSETLFQTGVRLFQKPLLRRRLSPQLPCHQTPLPARRYMVIFMVLTRTLQMAIATVTNMMKAHIQSKLMKGMLLVSKNPTRSNILQATPSLVVDALDWPSHIEEYNSYTNPDHTDDTLNSQIEVVLTSDVEECSSNRSKQEEHYYV